MQKKHTDINPIGAFILMFAPIGAVLYLQILGSIFASEWVIAIAGLNFDGTYAEYMKRLLEYSNSTLNSIIVLVFYSTMALVLFTIWYRMAFHPNEEFKNPFAGLSGKPAIFVLGIIVFAIGAHFFCSYMATGIAVISPKWYEEYTRMLDNAGLNVGEIGLFNGIYAVILGPIVEELTFRGLTFRYARIALPLAGANVVQALLFAALHGNMLQACYAFVFALMLGYICYKYNNLVVTIIIHILFNGVALVIEALTTRFIGSIPELEAATSAIPNFSNVTVAVSFAIAFFMSMLITYAGITLLNKAADSKPDDSKAITD